MRLYEYRYTYSTSAQAYVKHPGIGCALAHRFGMTKAATNPAAPADFPPPPVGEGRGGVCPHTADAAKTTKTAPSLTYTSSAQAYVNHPGIGCALAYRRCVKHAAFMVKPRWLPPPQPSPAAGFALRGRASFCGISDFHPHHQHSASTLAHRRLLNCPTVARSPTALLPLPVGLKQLARSATSICSRSERKGWGEGSKKSSVASTIDLYRDHFTCPNTTGHTARNPTPALPHGGGSLSAVPPPFAR